MEPNDTELTAHSPLQIFLNALLAVCGILGVLLVPRYGFPALLMAAAGSATYARIAHRRRHQRPWQTDAGAITGAMFCASGLVWLAAVALSGRADTPRSSSGPSGTTTAPRQTVQSSFPGQIVGGNHNVMIADLTSRSGFRSHQRASACHRLQYRIRIYNPGPNKVSRVRVAASINTITRHTKIVPTVTASAPDAQNAMVAFQPTITLPTPQTQAYVAGSTQILNSAGHVIKNSRAGDLADDITTTGRGIDIGTVGVGVTEYVEFQTKLSSLR